jgi:hypothetical protein
MPSRHLLGSYGVWKINDAPRGIVLSSGAVEVFDPASQNYQGRPILNLVANLWGQRTIGSPRVGRFSAAKDGVFGIRQKFEGFYIPFDGSPVMPSPTEDVASSVPTGAEGRGDSVILKNVVPLELLISSDIRKDWIVIHVGRKLWPNPGSLPQIEGVAALANGLPAYTDAPKQSNQGCACDDARADGNVVQMFSCTKVRIAASLLLAVVFIVLGRSLLSYGEGLGNFDRDVAFWVGYLLTLAAGLISFVLTVSLVAHLAHL